ncbi:RNA polymerase sigma factor [Agromyces larvae]|uniref:RNA polymerase sigma factor n=1 Tax=Agromyces larvae TaxID=2929802 RepID=A0ABY4BV66_9MICO|nr:RNA polymerase sigma factor [Agromyces larvae]
MQDTFLLLWKKRRRIRLVGNSVLPWLLTSARYLSANRRRYLGRRAAEPLEHSDSMDSTFDPGAIIARDEFQRFIDTAVLKLQPLDREILRLCIVEGLTYKEAAARLRTTHAVVRNRLSRARAALRADVSAYIRTEER